MREEYIEGERESSLQHSSIDQSLHNYSYIKKKLIHIKDNTILIKKKVYLNAAMLQKYHQHNLSIAFYFFVVLFEQYIYV